MTENLAEHLILHRYIRFAADMIAELRLDHAEGALDIGPLVVVLQELLDVRHTNISESAEIDLERIGLPREQARQIAIHGSQPYFKALVDAGVNQASLRDLAGS